MYCTVATDGELSLAIQCTSYERWNPMYIIRYELRVVIRMWMERLRRRLS